jgi:hypothetical protein
MKTFEGSDGDNEDVLHKSCSIQKLFTIFNDILRTGNETKKFKYL